MLTLPIQDVLPATPRARVVRIGLQANGLSFLPGQAVLVGTHGGDRRRPYSIASAPEDAEQHRYLELLVGVDAAGSPGPHLSLAPDTLVDVEGPLGRFTFPTNPVERRFLFIAGGTGIAPLRAMMRHALHVGHESIGVLYSARTGGEFAYEDELHRLAAQGRIDLRQTVTRDTTDSWAGGRGRIDRESLKALVHDPATLCFICGPPALVADMPKLLGELGVSAGRIRVEEWG